MIVRIYLFILVCIYCISHTNQYKSLDFSDDYNLDYNFDDKRGGLLPECQTALENFAEASSNYTLCIIKYSRPIRACKLCVKEYLSANATHDKILTTQVNGTKCRNVLINLDRLEIIETTFDNIKKIWNDGVCDKCFNWNNGTPTLSNKSEIFFNYYKIAMDCINDHSVNPNNTDQICKNCMTKYITLNTFYESLKGTSETLGICMDIVDTMNATRTIWSDELNCCKLRRTPEVIFLTCTAIITALPALFYVFARIYCEGGTVPKPAEQNRMAETLRYMPSTSQSIQS